MKTVGVWSLILVAITIHQGGEDSNIQNIAMQAYYGEASVN